MDSDANQKNDIEKNGPSEESFDSSNEKSLSEQPSKKELSQENDEDLMENVPKRFRQHVIGMISQSMKSTSLIDKFNDQHVDQIIQNMENESKRQYEFAVGERRSNCFYVLLIITVFLLLIFTIGPDTEIFKLIIIIASVAAGGFGVGIAYKK